MPFVESDVVAIRDLMQLSPRELYPSSCLRQHLTQIQANDIAYSIDLVGTIQGYLTAIAALDAQIIAIDSDPDNGGRLKRDKVDDEYEVDYQASKYSDPTAFLNRRRNELMGKLFRDLGFKYAPSQARLLRG